MSWKPTFWPYQAEDESTYNHEMKSRYNKMYNGNWHKK